MSPGEVREKNQEKTQETVQTSCDVLIQGAGIGGLTLAIALKQRGYAVTVVERAAELSEVGAGIWMAANPMQVFSSLGLADRISQAGWQVRRLRLQDARGFDIQVTDMSEAAKLFGFETIALHRAVLQRILYESLGAGAVLFAREIESLADGDHSMTAQLSDGSVHEAALVVGADGINSQIRSMAGLGGERRYSGSSSYRAVARAAHILPDEAAHDAYEIWAKGCRFGFSKINADDTYWYMTFDAPAGETAMAQEMRAHAAALFRSFFPQWMKLLEYTRPEEILRTDLSDLKPLRTWSSGRVGLVGDAAHATTPNLGQGGAMAVEDALALADALDRAGLNGSAFRAFEQRRRAKVDWTVSTSRLIGRICHMGNPLTRGLRNAALRHTPKSATQKQMARLYTLDKA